MPYAGGAVPVCHAPVVATGARPLPNDCQPRLATYHHQCDLEEIPLAPGEPFVLPVTEAPSLTLVVETADGTYFRTVQPATILPGEVEHGPAAEAATRNAAAAWGLPDFVFRPAVTSRGAGYREVGDAIVLVGRMGLSVQVKAREKPSTDVARERAWLDKKIKQATSQARGTIRALQALDEVALTNERGRLVTFDPRAVTWLRVIVLDHPGLDEYTPVPGAVVLLRRDWEFLFDQLRSTYAVVEYLHRIGDDDAGPLGEEPVRYYQLAGADAAAEPTELDARLMDLKVHGISRPLLPQAPVGHGDDQHHFLLRVMLEDVAVLPLPPDVTSWSMLEALAGVDAVPVSYRGELGRTLLQWLDETRAYYGSGLLWRTRWHAWPDRPFVVFGVASSFRPEVQDAFGTYVMMRHQEFIERIPERRDALTVGVLLTPRNTGGRLWDTTMVSTTGDQGLGTGDRANLERLWGKLGEHRPPPSE